MSRVSISNRVAIRADGKEQHYALIVRNVSLPSGSSITVPVFAFIPQLCDHRMPDLLSAMRFLSSDGKFSAFPKPRR